MSWLLVAALTSPLAGLLTVASGRLRTRTAARVGVWATALALAASVAGLLAVGQQGVISLELGGWLGWKLDALLGALMVLVSAVSLVVQAFAGRYLRGDQAQQWFVACALAVTVFSLWLASAATLWTVAAAWTATGLAVVVMIWRCSGEPLRSGAAGRAAVAFATGDAALWAAVTIAAASFGTPRLDELDPGEASTLAITAAALLIVAAGITRSAQLPAQRWLSDSLAAPTPVSALLHAGVVNGAGVLFIKLAPVLTASALAMHAAFAVGAATLVFAAAAMLARPDVKGSLAWSTVGQMGFMVLTCGLGAFTAAAFHLIAHGMYKASLFLGSGSAVQARVRKLQGPPVPHAGPRQLLLPALASAATAAAVLVLVFPGIYPSATDADTTALLVFVGVTATWLGIGWTSRQRHAAGYASGVLLVAAFTATYVSLSAAFAALVSAAVPAAQATADPWLLVPVGACLLAVGWVRAQAAYSDPLGRLLYTAALNAGAPKPLRTSFAPAATTAIKEAA